MRDDRSKSHDPIDGVLSDAQDSHDAEQYRLRQAEEVLRRAGYVPIPGTDRWRKKEDLPNEVE